MARPRKQLPPELTADDYQLLRAYGAEPVSLATVGNRHGLAPSTLRAILARNHLARAAWEAGRGEWETRLLKRLDDPTIKSIGGTIFALKSVFRYREVPELQAEESRVRIEVVLPKVLTPRQYLRELKEVAPSKSLPETVDA